MTDKREIFRHGRYEHCQIVYWPEGKGIPDYIIACSDAGQEMVCHYAMGIWCEMNAMDVIMKLRINDQIAAELHAATRMKTDER